MANPINIPPYCNQEDLSDAQNYTALEALDFKPDVQAKILWAYLQGRSDLKQTLLRREGLKDNRWLDLLSHPENYGFDGETYELLHQALGVIVALASSKSQNPKT